MRIYKYLSSLHLQNWRNIYSICNIDVKWSEVVPMAGKVLQLLILKRLKGSLRFYATFYWIGV